MSYDDSLVTNSFINIFTKGWKTTTKIDNMELEQKVIIPTAQSVMDINFNRNNEDDRNYDTDNKKHATELTQHNIIEKKTTDKEFSDLMYDNLSSNKTEQKKFVLYKFMVFIFKVLFIEFNIRNKTPKFNIEENINHITSLIFPDFINSLSGFYSVWKIKRKALKFMHNTDNYSNNVVTFEDFIDKYRVRMKNGIDSVVSEPIALEQKLTYERTLGQKLVIKNNKTLLIDGEKGYVEEQYPNFISNNIPLPYEPNDKNATFGNILLDRVKYSGESGNDSLDVKFKQIVEAIDKIALLIKEVKTDLSISYKYGYYTGKINTLVRSIENSDKKYLIKISKEFGLLNSINI